MTINKTTTVMPSMGSSMAIGGNGLNGSIYTGGQWNGSIYTGGQWTGGYNSNQWTNAQVSYSANYKSTTYDDLAATIIHSHMGSDFNISGPFWVRDDLSLMTAQMVVHFNRWIHIEKASDYGVIPRLSVAANLDIHPAFGSRETFDAFGVWWTAYSTRFGNNLWTSSFPTIPCGELAATFVVKSGEGSFGADEEFMKIYPSLIGDIWFENNKWIFTDSRDAVMAKMLWSQ